MLHSFKIVFRISEKAELIKVLIRNGVELGTEEAFWKGGKKSSRKPEQVQSHTKS